MKRKVQNLRKYFISELLSSPALDRYCTAVYWVVATMTSTGYGDIHGVNLLEMGRLSNSVSQV